MQPHMDDSCITPSLGDELDKAIFIIKYDDKSFKEMHKNCCLDHKITAERFSKSQEIKKFLEDNPEYIGKTINEICMAAGGVGLLTRIICLQYYMNELFSRI